ncbi:MAG: Glu/Leu/Phe/Val dehydrogenase [Thermodesulfovibrionales bacterium]|nr:Glu/Leu/Phe/Val dehydrogenase [Thermodesulfovibrionales bacterium]
MFFDDIGPQRIEEFYFPKSRLRAIVVIDNTALGPSMGGVRVSPSVTREEVIRLARTMTLKNSIAGLPHGGGKAGIIADPKDTEIEEYFRIFARSIKDIEEYIPGPDMGSNEESMAWVYDEIGRAVGLPEEIGGLPLDRLGATGFGLSVAGEVACKYAGMELRGSRIAIHGFGSVGKAAARFFAQRGGLIVAVADSKGAVYNPEGLDVLKLLKIKEEGGSVINFTGGERLSPEDLFNVSCDILIPAATADVINEKNADSIKARIILEGANIPVTEEAEEYLYKKGITVVPDFIANAGGVIMAAMEYARRTVDEAFRAIESKIRENTELILKRSEKEAISPRKAAVVIARERVLKAMRYRRF